MLRLLVVALGLAVPPPVHALPDLAVEVYGVELAYDQTVSSGDVVEGCAGEPTGRTLLRFGTLTRNLGPDDVQLGDPMCPDCTANPGVGCGNPDFECSPADGHHHPQFRSFNEFTVLDVTGTVLARGGKRSFCLRDNVCRQGVTPVYGCDNPGITAGCADDYQPDLGCQYVDVTDVADVGARALRLRVTADAADRLPDADRWNNTVEVVLPGCGDQIVQSGEECDEDAGHADPDRVISRGTPRRPRGSRGR